jgi:hypothetical protein
MKTSILTRSALFCTVALTLASLVAGAADAVKKLPEGKAVLKPAPEGHNLHTGPDGKFAEYKTVDVTGQPFKQAIQAKVKQRPSDPWHAQVNSLIAVPVKKGDVVLASFYVRTLDSKNEGGKGQFSVYFGVPETELETTITQEILAGPKWTKVQIPATVAADYEAGKGMLNLDFGFEPQTLEFAEIKVTNYGSQVKVGDLPNTGY